MPKRNAKQDATVVPSVVADDSTVMITEEPTVIAESVIAESAVAESAVDKSAVAKSAVAKSAVGSTSVAETLANPHRIEIDVRHRLTATPHLHFSSLVVRRIANGVCLKGVVETDEQSPDICGLVRQVTGVQEVMNHLVVRNLRRPPAKG